MDARPECKYLLTYIRCLWGVAWFAPDHGRLAAGRRVVQEAIAQQPLALPELGLVRTRRSGWKRLYGYYLVEQRDVGENLAIRRCHRHSENRGLDGATTRQPELRPPDEIARAVDEDRPFDIRCLDVRGRLEVDAMRRNAVHVRDSHVLEAVRRKEPHIGKIGEGWQPHHPHSAEDLVLIFGDDSAFSVAPVVVAPECQRVVDDSMDAGLQVICVMCLSQLVLERIRPPEQTLALRILPRLAQNRCQVCVANESILLGDDAKAGWRRHMHIGKRRRNLLQPEHKVVARGNCDRRILRQIAQLLQANFVLTGRNREVTEQSVLVGKSFPPERLYGDRRKRERSTCSLCAHDPRKRETVRSARLQRR